MCPGFVTHQLRKLKVSSTSSDFAKQKPENSQKTIETDGVKIQFPEIKDKTREKYFGRADVGI